jgi:hypothetical protein
MGADTSSSGIYGRARNLWSRLPENFRLEGSMLSCKRRNAFEQDFLLNARLTYLQIFFLLHDRESIQRDSLGSVGDILAISQEMLSLVVEAIVLRDRLVNSGTGLVWKVSVNLLSLREESNQA